MAPILEGIFRTEEGAQFDVKQYADGRMVFTGRRSGLVHEIHVSRVETRRGVEMERYGELGVGIPLRVTFDTLATDAIVNGYIRVF